MYHCKRCWNRIKDVIHGLRHYGEDSSMFDREYEHNKYPMMPISDAGDYHCVKVEIPLCENGLVI